MSPFPTLESWNFFRSSIHTKLLALTTCLPACYRPWQKTWCQHYLSCSTNPSTPAISQQLGSMPTSTVCLRRVAETQQQTVISSFSPPSVKRYWSMLSGHQRVPTLTNMTFWMMLNVDSWRKDHARPSSFWQLMTWQRNWTNEANQHHHVTFARAFQHGTPPIPPLEAPPSQHLGLHPSLLSSEQDKSQQGHLTPGMTQSFSLGLTLFFVYADDLGPTSKPIYDCSQITSSSTIKATSQTPTSTSVGPGQALEELSVGKCHISTISWKSN